MVPSRNFCLCAKTLDHVLQLAECRDLCYDVYWIEIAFAFIEIGVAVFNEMNEKGIKIMYGGALWQK